MFRSTIIAAIVGALTLMFAVSANAAPLAVAKTQIAVESDVTRVQGCPPGMRWSNSRQTCVERRGGPQGGPGPGYSQGGYGMMDPQMARQSCQQRCLQRRDACNYRKGGYFNGCGVQGAACLARCD